MARIFGAPETVPAGKQERKASKQSFPSSSMPVTVEVMCMTWLKRSTTICSSIRTVP